MGVQKARSTCATVPEKVTHRRPAATWSTRKPPAWSQAVTRSRSSGDGPEGRPELVRGEPPVVGGGAAVLLVRQEPVAAGPGPRGAA